MNREKNKTHATGNALKKSISMAPFDPIPCDDLNHAALRVSIRMPPCGEKTSLAPFSAAQCRQERLHADTSKAGKQTVKVART